MAKYTEFCNQILNNVGGKENVSSAVHCMTRLRLNLKDKSKVNVEAVRSIKGAVGAQFSGEQFQIIIGQHVSDVYPEFCAMAGLG
ncbi:MAG: PTS transporter subunit EIIB, partial [Floccifex porci]